jgi:hypothetical protein
MGRNFCLTLIDFTTDEFRREIVMKELEQMHPKNIDSNVPQKDPADCINDIDLSLKSKSVEDATKAAAIAAANASDDEDCPDLNGKK